MPWNTNLTPNVNSLETEFWDIAGGLLITFIGLTAALISVFRIRRRGFSLLNFGLFFLIYGARWLLQSSSVRALAGLPNPLPYFPFTYLLVIPLSAFLVDIFGPGPYQSMRWTFRSTVVYAIIGVVIDLTGAATLPDPEIHPIVVVIWCIVWGANLLFIKRKTGIELHVTRTVCGISLLSTMNDQLVNMRVLPWDLHMEHAGLLVLCGGVAFVAAHHVFTTEKKLLAVDKEIEIARRIQTANLPSMIATPQCINIAARYIPMSTVAGDFYDIHTAGDRGVGILIADVSGHGVGAALIGSMLKVAFASQSVHIADPARVLAEINIILQGKIEHSFVTACSVFIDVRAGQLRYANAGHPSPLLWKGKARELHRCTVAGTILGPFPDAVYDNATVDIVKGDRLLLHTDGIAEATNSRGEFFGEDRMISFMEENTGTEADRVADQLVGHLSTWSGKGKHKSFDDDITFLLVDVVGPLTSAHAD